MLKRKPVNEVRYTKAAAKFIKSRGEKEKEKLKKIIEENLMQVPAKGDIKPLKGYKDNRRRLRVGDIRIIFRYDSDNNIVILYILDIGNRGDVYKKKGGES